VVCCQVEVSATSQSFVQKSTNERGVSECDREASIMRRPWPTRGSCAMGGKYGEDCQVCLYESVSKPLHILCCVKTPMNEMGGACSAYRGEERYVQGFGGET
jgi:hypothetical protein